MKHWKLSYQRHLNFDKFEYKTIPEHRITYVTFDKWQILYNADPGNWHYFYSEGSHWGAFDYIFYNYYIPYYQYPFLSKNNINAYHFIKFLTKKDYKKFVKFILNNEEEGTDYQNQKELLYLTQQIGDQSTKRLEAAQKEVQKAYKENKRIMEKSVIDLLKEGEAKG